MTADDLQRTWEVQVVGKLRPVAAGLFREVTVVAHDRNVVSVRLSEGVPIEQARRRQNEVEAILSDLLDQTIRLEVVSPAAQGSAESPSTTGAPDTQAPPTPVPVPADAYATDRSIASAASPASGSPAAEPGAGSPVSDAPAAPPASGAASQEAKVQRILDRFPGSKVVRDDEATT